MSDDVVLWEEELDDHDYGDEWLAMIARCLPPRAELVDPGWGWRECLVVLIGLSVGVTGFLLGFWW